MNIDQLKDEKELLENSIRELLIKFNEKTDFSINSVNVQITEGQILGRKRNIYNIGKVSVNVYL